MGKRNVLVHKWMSSPPVLQGETMRRRSAAATHSLFLPVLHLTNLMKNFCKAAVLLLPLPLRLIACQFDVKLLFCPFSPLFCHERYQIYAIIHDSLLSLPPLFSCIFDLSWKAAFQKSAPSLSLSSILKCFCKFLGLFSLDLLYTICFYVSPS